MDSALIITNIQVWLAPFDDTLRWLSLHTYAHFYLLIAAILYLSGFAKVGARMACATLLSTLIFGVCRHFFASTRPYWDHPQLFKGLYETVWGMPSGHSQTGMIFWGLTAYSTRKLWCWVIAFSLIASIALSRLFLGLHYPDQIFFGLIVGLCILILWIRLESTFIHWLLHKPGSQQVIYTLLLTCLPLLITLILRELLNIGQGNGSAIPYKFLFHYTGLFQSTGLCLLFAFQRLSITRFRLSIPLVIFRTLPALLIVIPLWQIRFIALDWFESHYLIYFTLWLHGALIAAWVCLLWPWLHQYLSHTCRNK